MVTREPRSLWRGEYDEPTDIEAPGNRYRPRSGSFVHTERPRGATRNLLEANSPAWAVVAILEFSVIVAYVLVALW